MPLEVDLIRILGQPSGLLPVLEVPSEDHATRCSSVEWSGTGCQIHSETIRPLALEAIREGFCPSRVLGDIRSFSNLNPTYPTWSWYDDHRVNSDLLLTS